MSTHQKNPSLFAAELMRPALVEAFKKLNPAVLYRNPVMFTVELGTAIMLVMTIYALLSGDSSQGSFGYNLLVFIVLFLTVLFANFAEAIAEARGKAQAESLRKTREDTPAKVLRNGKQEMVSSSVLKKGDVFICEAGHHPHGRRNH